MQPGTTSSQVTSLTDVMATVAKIVGNELPDDTAKDSFNMLPAWLDEDCDRFVLTFSSRHFKEGRLFRFDVGHGNIWTTLVRVEIATQTVRT